MKVRIKETGEVVEVQDFGEKFVPRYWTPNAEDESGIGLMAEEVEVLPPGTKTSYHFDIGNSNVGPLGAGARIVAESQEAAVARLRSLLEARFSFNGVYDIPILGSEAGYSEDVSPQEYLAIYLNPEAVTVEDI